MKAGDAVFLKLAAELTTPKVRRHLPSELPSHGWRPGPSVSAHTNPEAIDLNIRYGGG
jgi:hypothetical protein